MVVVNDSIPCNRPWGFGATYEGRGGDGKGRGGKEFLTNMM